jgi:hypothetical protein
MKISLPAALILAFGLALATSACATATPEPMPSPVPPTTPPPGPPPTAATTGNAPPAVQIVPLQEGTTFVVGTEVGVAVLASDSDGIGSAGLLVDGEVVATLEGTSGTLFQGTLLWTPSTPGPHNVGVVVYDSTGAVADVAARQVTVVEASAPAPAPSATPAGDTVPPAVSITPLETEVSAGSDVDVAVNAVDSAGVVSMELYVNGEVKDSWQYDPASGPAPQSAFETLTWRDSSAGEHQVYVTATDTAGNVGQSVTETVTVTQ